MYKNFDNLSPDKKSLIIRICIEEFAENGYQNASTNRIVKKAGISKGILFHYFGSKKNLYLYILDTIVGHMTERFYQSFSAPDDIFERILLQYQTKVKLAYEQPQMYEILYAAFEDTPSELKEEIAKRYAKVYEENMPRFYENLDTSRFKKGIDAGRAVEIATIFSIGLTYMHIKSMKRDKPQKILSGIDTVYNEARAYFETLKKLMYEQE